MVITHIILIAMIIKGRLGLALRGVELDIVLIFGMRDLGA